MHEWSPWSRNIAGTKPIQNIDNSAVTYFLFYFYIFLWNVEFKSSDLKDPEGKPKKANIRDNQDGTYLVSYVPDMTGRYTILIKYGGDEIPYSPYRIRALPTGDASKCTVTGKLQNDKRSVTNQR